MLNKIKSMATGVANKVKTAFSAKQTELTAKIHAVLDGTVMEKTLGNGKLQENRSKEVKMS